ncbi:MAG TPA: erythromycin esterase family protein [Longimicrobiaceae bacterium]
MPARTLRTLALVGALALAGCGDGPTGNGGGGDDDLSGGVGTGAERLLSDAEMATPADPGAPAENPAWGAWAEANHRPVRSLTSNNFADLEFLRPLLQGKRIVQLGESSHGVAEYSEAKTRLIKFLHQEMGFEVLAFESGLYECWQAERNLSGGTAANALRDCLFGVWWVQEAAPLFDYLAVTRSTARPLRLAGFDVQQSGRASSGRPRFLRELVATVDPVYADSVARVDSVFAARTGQSAALARAYLATEGDRLAAFYAELTAFLERNHDAIARASSDRPEAVRIATQAARQTPVLIRMLRAPDADAGTPIRDRGMADNLEFLLQQMYPGKKVIVWAHNFHIRHGATVGTPPGYETMGVWVSQRHRAELYTIALYAYRGKMRSNAGQVYDVFPTPAGSLESILYRARRKHFFVDLSGAARTPATEWMYVPIVARSSGANEERMVVRDQYDGVLFIDPVRNPQPLR